MKLQHYKPLWSLPVIVGALGYFVDIYDLLLFSIVRKASLASLGIPEAEQFEAGEFLLQVQMTGLLIGGILWGILGDKRGRLSVLFGSILIYSLANLANGFVTDLTQYAVLRFIAGVGLAGELGAGVTLVSELLPARLRGYATAIIAAVGMFGAVLANVISKEFSWQTCYFIGGGLGLALLAARVSILESGIYLQTREKQISRGNFFMLFTNLKRFRKFMGCIFIGLPIWFVIGILVTFSPEFAGAIGIEGVKSAGDAVMFSYLGLAAGDLVNGVLSQMLRSRKKVVGISILMTMIFIVWYLFTPVKSDTMFYVSCFLLGTGIGYWALFVTIAAEQFGTNLRSTVATSVPNFIRGTVVPLTLVFRYLRDVLSSPAIGLSTQQSIIYGALIIGLITIGIASISLSVIDETFGRELDFTESD